MSDFTPTDFCRGDRVYALTSDCTGTFLGYRTDGACPDTHISYPGMRLADYRDDIYGPRTAWETDLAPATGSLTEQAEAHDNNAEELEDPTITPQPWLPGARRMVVLLRVAAQRLRFAARYEVTDPESAASVLIGRSGQTRQEELKV